MTDLKMTENYQKLEVWKKSMALAERVYSLSRMLPKEETLVLGNQMRRAAVSIPSNIAEGQARGGREFIRFLKVAKGSRSELETQILLCLRLNYLPSEDAAPALNALAEISKMMASLIKVLESKS